VTTRACALRRRTVCEDEGNRPSRQRRRRAHRVSFIAESRRRNVDQLSVLRLTSPSRHSGGDAMPARPDLEGDSATLASLPRALVETPVIRLLAAILADACFCLEPASLVSRDTRDDTVAWVRGEIESAAFCSFGEVCDILGLDLNAVRATMLARAELQPRTQARASREFTARSRARHAPVSSVRHR
jgi:hypothetical protein